MPPSRKRPDWSRRLPRPLVIPKVITLATLADVRKLMPHLPKERRALSTWQHVAAELDKAASGANVSDVAIVLRLVLMLEHVEYRPAVTLAVLRK
jgi:hypothetical protein